MEFNGERKHMVDILFVLTLFFVFALSALTLVVLGANVYRSTVNHMDESFTDRTSYAYVTQKLRQNDESGALSVGEFGGCNACIITQEINNTIYNTYIYAYDGYLCELLTRADMDMGPEDGTRILELNDFEIEQITPKLSKIHLSFTDGEEMSVYVSTHTDS
ncbi:MAG: DUF4860 domain-containing protein [Lachnospiraceae bacterium]|nr:DUF4860 domain-containing protein [Lachnospiraceae bacterium]